MNAQPAKVTRGDLATNWGRDSLLGQERESIRNHLMITGIVLVHFLLIGGGFSLMGHLTSQYAVSHGVAVPEMLKRFTFAFEMIGAGGGGLALLYFIIKAEQLMRFNRLTIDQTEQDRLKAEEKGNLQNAQALETKLRGYVSAMQTDPEYDSIMAFNDKVRTMSDSLAQVHARNDRLNGTLGLGSGAVSLIAIIASCVFSHYIEGPASALAVKATWIAWGALQAPYLIGWHVHFCAFCPERQSGEGGVATVYRFPDKWVEEERARAEKLGAYCDQIQYDGKEA